MLFPFPFAAKVWHALPHWPEPRTGGCSSLCVPSCLGAAFSCSPPCKLSPPSAKQRPGATAGGDTQLGFVHIGRMVMGVSVITETTDQTLPKEAPGGLQGSDQSPSP